MKQYRKVSQSDVFKVIVDYAVEISGYELVVSVPHIAEILGASKYQVRKHIKALEMEGTVVHIRTIDNYAEDTPVFINGYTVTKLGEHSSEYRNAWENQLKEINKLCSRNDIANAICGLEAHP